MAVFDGGIADGNYVGNGGPDQASGSGRRPSERWTSSCRTAADSKKMQETD